MSDTPAIPNPPKPPVHPAWVVAGVIFITLWVFAHVALLILSFASGLFADIALYLLKTVMIPGLVINSPRMEMAWVMPLQIGVILAGAAGVPAGLAFFWRGRRLLLWVIFGVLFAAGVAMELYAVYRLVADSLGGLAQ